MHYRVLLLGNGGVVETFFDLVAHDDSEAVAIARTELPRARPFELWKGSALVHSGRLSASH
jgi:hypothetical protein